MFHHHHHQPWHTRLHRTLPSCFSGTARTLLHSLQILQESLGFLGRCLRALTERFYLALYGLRAFLDFPARDAPRHVSQEQDARLEFGFCYEGLGEAEHSCDSCLDPFVFGRVDDLGGGLLND